MELNAGSSSPEPRNLTGQVSLLNPNPTFSGGYSSVYLGSLNGNYVALKVIRPVGDHTSVRRRLFREMTVWSTAIHPNIHPFYGYAHIGGFGPFGALVSPWCLNGDASQFLRENGERLNMAERVNLWKGVVEGVAYLHGHNPPIVHGDLKPGNILIEGAGTPRICDFGLARIFLDQVDTGMTTTSDYTGTPRYLAPELVASETNVPPTFESDVYALGSLGLEFIYLQQPYSQCPNNFRGLIYRVIREGLGPAATMPQREWPAARLWPLILTCWSPNPLCRPTALNVAYALRWTNLSLPISVLERIVSLAAAIYKPTKYPPDGVAWDEYTCNLRNFCLVSRAFWTITTPILYGDIRISLDKTTSSLFSLIHTLTSTKERALPQYYVLNGYGSHTKLLGLGVRRGTGTPDFVAVIQSLVYAMPNLQLVNICDEPLLARDLKLHAFRTLRFEDLDLTLFLDQLPTLLAVTCMQRLDLTHGVFSGEWPTAGFQQGALHAFPKVVLSHILAISVCSESNSEVTTYLKVMSNWKLPQFGSFDFTYLNLTMDDDADLLDLTTTCRHFLQTHGDSLRHLTLYHKPYGENLAEVLAEVLSLCKNLRFLSLRPNLRSILDLSHPHINLETIVVLDYTGDIISLPVNCRVFKSAAQHLFPKLVHASVRNMYGGDGVASFYAKDSFITGKFDGILHKLYDDGRTSPPLPDSPNDGDESMTN